MVFELVVDRKVYNDINGGHFLGNMLCFSSGFISPNYYDSTNEELLRISFILIVLGTVYYMSI